ncbi:MAG: GtrA family protein [Candidatus Symbiothrix sp.]|jgi:putative flippase GtrA|nr:GtrA family protein [Candidatus Symbiothrix sp.]
MAVTIKHRIKNFSAKGGIFMFLRAQVVSQLATWVDNLTAFALKKTLDFFGIKQIDLGLSNIEAYVGATIVGQIVGGIFIAIMNYRWTFKPTSLRRRDVAIKFFIIWLGSLCLNTLGTYQLTEWLRNTAILNKLLHHSDDIFILAKLFVALIVGIAWNYNMQRIFVYRSINIRQLFFKSHHERKTN